VSFSLLDLLIGAEQDMSGEESSAFGKWSFSQLRTRPSFVVQTLDVTHHAVNNHEFSVCVVLFGFVVCFKSTKHTVRACA
jgi:hypothetical protein